MSLHPPKWAKDIPEPFWQRYFDLMPIHEKMRTPRRTDDAGYLRVTLFNVHDELTKRIDAAAVADPRRSRRPSSVRLMLTRKSGAG